MVGKPVRWIASIIIVVGVFLFFRVIYDAITGSLVAEFFDHSSANTNNTYDLLLALFLSLPIPFHVVSIGLIIQKKWLTATWARIAWIAIVTSGCWLGLSLGIRTLVLN